MNKILIVAFFSLVIFSCQKSKVVNDPAADFPVPPPAVQPENKDTTIIPAPLVEGVEVGNLAWELSLPDSNGIFTKLSGLRGKIVLLDFWATWCKPCRTENKKLKDLYHKYNNAGFAKAKGFEVYMVSVSDTKSAWLQRLRVEQYNWKLNLFDEGGGAQWRYGIRSIPRNFLLDSNGIILAKDLRDTMVEQTLKKLLK